MFSIVSINTDLFGDLFNIFISSDMFYKNNMLEIDKIITDINACLKINNNTNELDKNFCDYLDDCINCCNDIKNYFQQLKLLQQYESIEDITKEYQNKIEAIRSISKCIWENWLKLRPYRFNDLEKEAIEKCYTELAKIKLDSNNEDRYIRGYSRFFKNAINFSNCIAITSLSANGKIPLEPGIFDLLIFDESSQCDLASALPLLYRSKSAVIIGDKQQLMHVTSLDQKREEKFFQKYKLDADYDCWNYRANSLFDLSLISSRSIQGKIIDLRDHHRSHSDIINFSNKEFYKTRLRVITDYKKLKFYNNKKPGIIWENVVNNNSNPKNTNIEEAKIIVQILKDLIDKKYEGSIGVVTPFRNQANYIGDLISKNENLNESLISKHFIADTVHKFQGDERDIMIFSVVLSRKIQHGAISFLQANGNLFNVAITRAKAQLIVVGVYPMRSRLYEKIC